MNFIDYMEANVSEEDYSILINELSNSYDSFSIFVPIQWSDYSYLKFAYPTLDIYSVQEIDDGTLTVLESDRIRNIKQIEAINNDKVYICYEKFKYVTYLEKVLIRIGLFKTTVTESQCSQGWIWNDPNLNLQKIMQQGRYGAYLVTVI